MCEECEFYHNCAHAARICREILQSGNFKGMLARFDERVKDCELFIQKGRRRYA